MQAKELEHREKMKELEEQLKGEIELRKKGKAGDAKASLGREMELVRDVKRRTLSKVR